MKLLLSKKEKARYYRRLRIKIYLAIGVVLMAGIGVAHVTLNLSWFQIKKHNTVVMTPAEKFAIWCSSSVILSEAKNLTCVWIDRQGLALEQAPLTEGSAISIIKSVDEGILVAGSPVTNERFIPAIRGILDGISKLPILVKEYSFNGRLQELTAIGVSGDKFVFSVRFQPNEKLFASLAEVIAKNNLKNFEYIDLTVENRIYLKQR